jgi:uncharacterized protein (TIGR02145 family)
MKIAKLICVVAFLAITLIHFQAVGQKAFYFGPDVEAELSDTIVFNLGEHGGQVQWQQSSDGEVWSDMPGENQSVLQYVADSTAYFRAEVRAGKCELFYSETKYVSVSKISDDVFLVDNSNMELVSDTTEIELGIYKYKGEEAQRVDTGMVLVGSKGKGYLRKVTEVMHDGNYAEVKTEQATVEDVFEYLDITDSTKILMTSDKGAMIGGVPVPVEVIYMIPGAKHSKDGKGIVFGDEVSFTASVEDEETGEAGEISLTVTKGSLKFEPALIRSFKIKWFKLQKVKMALQGTIEHDLEMELSCSVSKTFSKDFDIVKYRVGPYFMGVVPIFMEYTITAKVSMGFGVSGSIEMGYTSNISTTVGAQYNRDNDPKWSTIWDTHAGFDPHVEKPEFGFTAGAQFSVVPQVYMEIAGTQGPYINLEPYLKGEFETKGLDWEFAVKAGVDANLGYKVEILGKKVANFNTNLPIAEWILYEVDGENEARPPDVVELDAAQNIGYNSVLINGNCESMVGAPVTERGVYWGKSPNPHTSGGSKVVMGSGSGAFGKTVYGLTASTKYYIRAFATNSGGTTYSINDIQFTTGLPVFKPDTPVRDYDNNTYQTQRIGAQVWMAENLKVTHYQDGTIIPNLEDDNAWASDEIGAFQWFDNNKQWGDIYGGLYNFYAVTNSHNICPVGYRMPSRDDWNQLVVYVTSMDMADVSTGTFFFGYGDEFKSTRTDPDVHPRWELPNPSNNISGFSALPAGEKGGNGWDAGEIAVFWSNTIEVSSIHNRLMPVAVVLGFYSNETISIIGETKRDGYSVRCIKIAKD